VSILSVVLLTTIFVEMARPHVDQQDLGEEEGTEGREGAEVDDTLAAQMNEAPQGTSHSRYLSPFDITSSNSGSPKVDILPNTQGLSSSWPSPQLALMIGGCLLNIATKGTIGVFETLGSEFVVTHFGWSVTRTGLTFAVFGSLGMGSLLCFRLLLRVFGDVNLIIYGICLMIISCLLLFQMWSWSIQELRVYFSLLLMYAVGYPVGHTAVLGVVSKIVKSGPQGSLLGWFGSAGSLARIVFPLAAGYCTRWFDDTFIFGVLALILGATNFVVLIFRSKIEDTIR